MKPRISYFLLLFFFAISLPAQEGKTDSSIIFTPSNSVFHAEKKSDNINGLGIDVLLSNNGFGIAGFYRREFTRDLAGMITLGIAESKDDNEVEYVDYFGQSFVPGKINRFLVMPLMFGVQQRLFADDIMDSFRPYVNAGGGPTAIMYAPFRNNDGSQTEYFSSWGKSHTKYTMGAYVGFGALFGSDMGSITGINIRYYYIPLRSGIPSLMDPLGEINYKNDFGGFFITINLGSAL
jgi:hypothetical protein